MSQDLFALIPTAVVALLWYLVKQKDEKIDKALQTLWVKHEEDAAELQHLKVQIASDHYKKMELDFKFEKLDNTIKESFNTLGCKFDKLTNMLIKSAQHEED